MTRYRLPEALGGGECVDRCDHGVPLGSLYARVEVGEGDELFTVDLLRSLLTEIRDPLPVEPPLGSVVLAQLVDEDRPWIWERMADHTFGEGWYTTGDNGGCFPWSSLCKRGNPTLLIPDPFAEPVELPWKTYDVEVDQLRDEGKPAAGVYLSTKPSRYGFAHLTPAVARTAARALWAAADQAERAS